MKGRQRTVFSPWAVWLALLVIGSRVAALYLFHVFDDAFITFRYAQNLAAGNGFVYNVGERVLGTTAPLFGLLNAFFLWVGLPLPTAAVVFNLLADLAILFVTFQLLPRRQRALQGVIFGVLFATVPSLARISVGGMEMSLFILLSLLAIWLFLKGRAGWAALTAALTYAVRPEGLILLLVLALVALYRAGLQKGVRFSFLGGGVVVGIMGMAYLLYGQFLPQSLVAKSQLVRLSFTAVLWDLFTADPLLLLLLPLALLGVVLGVGHSRLVQILGLWGVVYTLAYALAGPRIWPWYGAPIYFCVVALAAVGISQVAMGWLSTERVWQAVWLSSLLPIAVWLGLWLGFGPSGISQGVYRPLEAWCAQNESAEATYLAADIGALGFYCEGYVYDIAGLVSPQIEPYRNMEEVIRAVKPQYLFLNQVEASQGLVEGDSLGGAYAAVATFPPSDVSNIEYEAAVWVQKYVIFEWNE